jgi:peptide/nickel transport system substrate-binding protein
MRRAGYPTGRYTGSRRLRVVGSNDAAGAAVAQIVVRTLRGLGFPVRLRLFSLEKQLVGFCERPSAHVAVCPNAAWFKDFRDPQTVLDAPFNGENIVPEVNPNIAELNVPALNRAMDEAKLRVDPTQRARAWAAIDRRVIRQAPGAGWLWQRASFVSSRDVVAVPNRAVVVWDFASMARR